MPEYQVKVASVLARVLGGRPTGPGHAYVAQCVVELKAVGVGQRLIKQMALSLLSDGGIHEDLWDMMYFAADTFSCRDFQMLDELRRELEVHPDEQQLRAWILFWGASGGLCEETVRGQDERTPGWEGELPN